MKQYEKTPANCLILGSGALGLLLNYNLTWAASPDSKERRVLMQTRTIVPQPVSVDLGNSGIFHLNAVIRADSPSQSLASFVPDTVFLCVPPEATEPVFFAWLESFEAAADTGKNIEIVFCNNGCLTASTLSRLEHAHPQLSFLRALFFVGAMRVIEPRQTLVRWTGGQRVVWDWLRPAAAELQTPAFLGASVHQSETQEIGFTQWRREKDIFAAERSKFFTNFMLAAAIGPKLAKNKTLSESLGDSIVSLQAQQFSVLWEQHGVTAKQLQTTLLSTVAATGENINSLSYAAAQGHNETMAWFLQSVEQEIFASQRLAELNPLVSFLHSIRAQWGMDK